VRAQLSIDRSRSRFADRLGELGSGYADTDDRFHGGQLRVTGESPRLAGGLTIESSGLLRDERAQLHDAASGRADPPASRRVTRGVSLGLRLEPWPGRVLLRAGRRWDRQRDALRWISSLGVATVNDLVRELNAPQLGARVRVIGALDLKANWTRAHRAPDFLELFGNEGSIRGNPALQPERSENWDAGGGWSFPAGGLVRGSIEWAHFEQRARDLITYMNNSATSMKAMNISRARIRGEELSGRLELPRGVSFSGWWTWQSTLNQGRIVADRGRRLPLRPERHASGQLGWRGRRFDVSAEIEYLAEDFMDGANRKRVQSRTFTGASAGFRALPGARLVFEAKNLGDVRAADVAGFPLPGRSLFLSCEWDASPHAHP
jgi:iron complex outermembrane receptor protein